MKANPGDLIIVKGREDGYYFEFSCAWRGLVDGEVLLVIDEVRNLMPAGGSIYRCVTRFGVCQVRLL